MDIVLFSLLVGGLVTGFSKFSVGGMGLIILPIIMLGFPGPEALGILIPMYILTDVMAVFSYRSKIAWGVLIKLLPLALIGVVLGGWLLSGIDAEKFTVLLGVTIIFIIGLGVWLDSNPTNNIMQHSSAAYLVGLSAGFISLIANAAGPLFSLFLIEQKLSKETYVSTRAWAFLIINASKLPMLYWLGFMNWHTFKLSMQGIPGLVVGAAIGYCLLRRLNLKQFKWLIRGMAAIAAIKLLLFS
ncbi:MAG: sulfite exporter TauE/SafE family protein [Arenicella sp.]